jgi:NAD(P)-dependent dehydrogenase (short-subunit alcohol dehydrogenase family)
MSTEQLLHPKATPEKVALVTAGSAGLGAQIVRALAPDFRIVS